MNQRVVRAFRGALFLLLALGVASCAKRVPLPDKNFEAQQKVVLTMKDGRTVSGRIAPGQRVEYRAGDSVYESQVETVTPDSIRLGSLVLIDQSGSYAPVTARMAKARLDISGPIPAVTLSRSDVDKVELLRFDTKRAIKSAGFWAYGGALLLLFFDEWS